MRISSIGDRSRLSSLVSHVVELDLAWNNIQSWTVVDTIFTCLPSLKRLNLSHNPISAEIDGCLVPSSSNLHALALNGVNLSLSTIRKFLANLPCLEELQLSENNFSDLDFFDTSLLSESVSVLHLNASGIQQWSTIIHFLRRFPNLVRLFVAENELDRVEEVCAITGTRTQDAASCLRFLSLNNCRIREWNSIENLANLPRLEDLRVMHIPLFHAYSDEERFHLVVGRLRSIKDR